MTSEVVIESLVAGYHRRPIVGPASLTLHGGVTALLGRNGAGKTTLMRTMCGIVPAIEGSCTLNGQHLVEGASALSAVGYLGHDSALATGLTVGENLHFWQTFISTYPQISLMDHQEVVAMFQLEDLVDRKVRTLSRGQRQRADLARLAMAFPEFLILDEPLTGLDPVFADQVRGYLTGWGQECTVLYSTHSIPEALAVAQNFVVIHRGEVTRFEAGEEGVDDHSLLKAMEG